MSEIINPINDQPVSKESADYIRDLRAVRSGARKFARSGHPARRAEGRKMVNVVVPNMIRQVYVTEAHRSQ